MAWMRVTVSAIARASLYAGMMMAQVFFIVPPRQELLGVLSDSRLTADTDERLPDRPQQLRRMSESDGVVENVLEDVARQNRVEACEAKASHKVRVGDIACLERPVRQIPVVRTKLIYSFRRQIDRNDLRVL